MDNSDEERASKSYDQYIQAKIMLPDQKVEKLLVKVRKRIKHDDTITGEGHYNSMHKKSTYEVDYPDGMTELLIDNMID